MFEQRGRDSVKAYRRKLADAGDPGRSWRKQSETWFDGTVESVDRRIAACERLLGTRRAAIAHDGVTARHLAAVEELENTHTALQALRRDLLTAASDRHDRQHAEDFNKYIDWMDLQPQIGDRDYDPANFVYYDEDGNERYGEPPEHLAGRRDDNIVQHNRNKRTVSPEEQRAAQGFWDEIGQDGGPVPGGLISVFDADSGIPGVGTDSLLGPGNDPRSLGESVHRHRAGLSDGDRRYVELESARFARDNSDVDREELLIRARHHAEVATSTLPVNRSRAVVSAFVARTAQRWRPAPRTAAAIAPARTWVDDEMMFWS